NEGKEILFSLLEKIGSCTYNVPVNKNEIAAALTYYQNL
nr:3-dehydroquinate synthase [Algoriphagus sp.]